MVNWNVSNTDEYRKKMAVKGFDMVTRYDAAITNYFEHDIIFRRYEKQSDLK